MLLGHMVSGMASPEMSHLQRVELQEELDDLDAGEVLDKWSSDVSVWMRSLCDSLLIGYDVI